MAKKRPYQPAKCYHCGKLIETEQELAEKEIPLAVKGKYQYKRRKFHLDCLKEYVKTMENTKERKTEQSDFDKCYLYFKKTLDIPEDKALDEYAVLRLSGLRLGKFMPNGQNVRGLQRGYSFEVILTTMKFCSLTVNKAFSELSFTDQKHKVNFAMKIYIDNINFIDSKIRKLHKQEQMLEKLQPTQVEHELPKYIKKGGLGTAPSSLMIDESVMDPEYSIDELTELFK